jgi:DNA primase
MYAFLRWHSDLVLEDLRRRIDEEVAAHRGWYVFEGILFLVIGLLAVLVPGVPIRREADFSEAKPWAKNLAGILNEREPDLTTLEQRKNKRGDRVFIDILRNEYGQTSIAPYSLRARKGAPIATPIEWDELKDNSFGPRSYKVENIFRRLSQKGDPWAEFASYRNGTDKLYSLDIE